LLGLLAFSATVLKEPVGRREIGGVVAILAGVTFIALADPQRGGHADPGLAFMLVGTALALVALSAFVLRRPGSAGLLAGAIAADALGALAAAEAAGALPKVPPTVAWCALAAAGGVAAVAAESAVLQRRGAARVAPVVLAGQVAVPVALAPLVIGERWGNAGVLVCGLALVIAGSALLASSAGVSRLAVGHEPEDEVGGLREVGDRGV
jgi:drug/metabolite transporter (DMT)-like permease